MDNKVMRTPYGLAAKRYAVKKFDTKKKIPKEKIVELREVLRLAPSSINIQPWHFTFVQNTNIKSLLALAVGYAAADDHNNLSVRPKSRRPFNKVIKDV
ncbi:MAG: nitroreductase family protein [Niabella sp.]